MHVVGTEPCSQLQTLLDEPLPEKAAAPPTSQDVFVSRARHAVGKRKPSLAQQEREGLPWSNRLFLSPRER